MRRLVTSRVLLLTCGVVGAAMAVPARGQSPQASAQPAPQFEAASVKPSAGIRERAFDLSPGGRFAAKNATLRDLVQMAYALPSGRLRLDAQIVGGPAWINSDRFDVVAKAEGMPAGLDARNTAQGAVRANEITAINQVRLMLRTLLSDRFKLAAHDELRPLPMFALVKARNDGRLGPQLHSTDVDCVAARDAGKGQCGGFRALEPGHVIGRVTTMSAIAQLLEGAVNNVVSDSTGLTGSYDMELRWAPDQLQRPAGSDPAVNPDAPSIFAALQEQLGLKLESVKGPVDVLVIDRVEKPTPD